MWTKEQGQAIGRIVNEYRNNPANAKKRLTTKVFETQEGLLELLVRIGREEKEWLILADGEAKTDF